MQDSQAHAKLKSSLEALMGAHSDRFGTAAPGRLSIFIGATAAILEALERGVETIHVCAQPLMESHSTAIWRELSVERLGEHVFRYRLAERSTYIAFGAEDASIEAYLEPRVDMPRPQ